MSKPDISRAAHLTEISRRFESSPVVALLGARQVGKSTLARRFAEDFDGPVHYFDLERREDLRRLDEEWLAVERLEGLVVLDEIHRRPDLFPMLRVLADRPGSPARFLVLGSAAPELLRQSSETLAGRIAFVRLDGFGLDEVGADKAQTLWIRGGFPRSFLANGDRASLDWRRDFIDTFLRRDLGDLGLRFPAQAMDRLWHMLAHWHGQVLNASELGRNFEVSHHTIRRWVDALIDTFVVRELRPWHENLAKRQVKMPKIYVADTGLLHALLDLETVADVERHPQVGASWEGFAIETVVRRLGARPEQCWFWATHASAELDLLVTSGTRRLGFEIKRTVAPEVTASMRIARADLKLDSLDVIHGGRETFAMRDGFRAVALARVLSDVQPLRPDPGSRRVRPAKK